MVLGRAAVYFEQVAKWGSVRQAATHLHIASSAVDRQILLLEEHVGLPLFERAKRGMRLTPAGEMFLSAIRKCRSELRRVESYIDDLQGLRRGEVSVALVEGAADFVIECLTAFRTQYPGIIFNIHVAGSRAVVERVLTGEDDFGVTFDPPKHPALQVERKLLYRLGIVAPPNDPLAKQRQVSLLECIQHPLIIPDESISLRKVVNEVWARSLGGVPTYAAACNSVGMIRAMVKKGLGLGMTTALDVMGDLERGELSFIPLAEVRVPASTMCIVSLAGRPFSVPVALLMKQLSRQISALMPAR